MSLRSQGKLSTSGRSGLDRTCSMEKKGKAYDDVSRRYTASFYKDLDKDVEKSDTNLNFLSYYSLYQIRQPKPPESLSVSA
jgi:hypothetical protein